MFITCNVFLFFCLYFSFDIFGVVFVLFLCCVFHVIWQVFFGFTKRIYIYIYIHTYTHTHTHVPTYVCMYVSEWVSVVCCQICVGLITHLDQSYRVWRVWVWSWRLDNEEALAHWGLLRHKKNIVLPEQSSDTVRHGVIWCQKSSHRNRVSRNDRK